MAIIGNISEGIRVSAMVAVDAATRLFANVDPLNDLLKLVQKINKIIEEKWNEILPLKQISIAVAQITDFVGARNFVGRLFDILSGRAAWAHPFCDGYPDFLKVMSKCIYLVGDMTSIARWLSNIHILGKWVTESTAQLVSWGKEFKILKGVGDVSCITGAVLNFFDTVRLVCQEICTTGYMREGTWNFCLMFDHLLDVASDIAKIASAVLSNIPAVGEACVAGVAVFGSLLSLGKFFKNEYTDHQLQRV